ncbi:MAG TPA: ORF6N domain-containing protein [Bryobacteraceae bacterium]|nr:ORF6N domain-containing protein [Bryobacteraceae bacterium]
MSNQLAIRPHRLPVPAELIERRIYVIRGQKVMLDADSAGLYQVPTKAVNQAVKRNLDRFPVDFMFRLNKDETAAVNRSQFVTGSQRHRNPRLLPYAFTEHGVAMLSSVLNSRRAVQLNIFIIRVFMKLREVLATHKDLAHKIDQFQGAQKDHAVLLGMVVRDIQALAKNVTKKFGSLSSRRRRKPQIGFKVD